MHPDVPDLPLQAVKTNMVSGEAAVETVGTPRGRCKEGRQGLLSCQKACAPLSRARPPSTGKKFEAGKSFAIASSAGDTRCAARRRASSRNTPSKAREIQGGRGRTGLRRQLRGRAPVGRPRAACRVQAARAVLADDGLCPPHLGSTQHDARAVCRRQDLDRARQAGDHAGAVRRSAPGSSGQPSGGTSSKTVRCRGPRRPPLAAGRSASIPESEIRLEPRWNQAYPPA